jgi:hypothetical protein
MLFLSSIRKLMEKFFNIIGYVILFGVLFLMFAGFILSFIFPNQDLKKNMVALAEICELPIKDCYDVNLTYDIDYGEGEGYFKIINKINWANGGHSDFPDCFKKEKQNKILCKDDQDRTWEIDFLKD